MYASFYTGEEMTCALGDDPLAGSTPPGDPTCITSDGPVVY